MSCIFLKSYVGLFYQRYFLLKVLKEQFTVNVSIRHNEMRGHSEAWKAKLKREAEPDEEEKNNKDAYLKAYRSRRKPMSAEVTGYLSNFPKVFSWDPRVLKEIYLYIKKHFLLYDQRYIDQRVDILGFDLAAAHFIVYRNGKVRMKGTCDWIKKKKGDDDNYPLPNRYSPHYLIEAIDASGLLITYDGLLNIENLSHLKWLSFSKCPNFNDWCLDRLCDQNYISLQHLDISHCPLITESGLTTIAKLRSLKSLNVEGLDRLKNLRLICLLLQDSIPDLQIEGLPFEIENQISN